MARLGINSGLRHQIKLSEPAFNIVQKCVFSDLKTNVTQMETQKDSHGEHIDGKRYRKSKSASLGSSLMEAPKFRMVPKFIEIYATLMFMTTVVQYSQGILFNKGQFCSSEAEIKSFTLPLWRCYRNNFYGENCKDTNFRKVDQNGRKQLTCIFVNMSKENKEK